MEAVNSILSESCKIYQDTCIRNSRIGDGAVISDRAVILFSEIGDKVEIGRDCSVIYSSLGFGSYLGKSSMMKFTRVGKFCNLSWQLSIGGSNHNYRAACMYTDSWWKKTLGVGESLVPVEEEEYTQIGSDVWLGSKANIVRGVKIGDGAVIGANSLVLEDIPPYAIAVGTPAKVIKYRFDEQTVDRLLKIRWWDWDVETIRDAADSLRGDLNEEKLRALEEIAEVFAGRG